MSSTPDLFDAVSPSGPQAWSQAFDRWHAGQPLRQASSRAVYRSMWDAFATWCVARGLAPRAVGAADIEAFLLERPGLTDRHAWRWLMLLERALAPNPAAAALRERRPAWRHANAAHKDPLPEHLDGAAARRLVDWLLDERTGYAAKGAPAGSWQALRNRSAAALQLGAGLAPGDVRAALASGAREWKIRIPAHGAIAEREAPLARWAARLLRRWLDTRAALPMPGDVLFPGTREGRPWAKVSQYEAAQSVLVAAGVPADGGSFVLRHTFALRQLRRGAPPEDVARWLGVTDPGVMERYRRVVFEPEDVV